MARAHGRAVCGEMHAGFANLRSARPMNLKGAAAAKAEPDALEELDVEF